jgi:hypothetical protein
MNSGPEIPIPSSATAAARKKRCESFIGLTPLDCISRRKRRFESQGVRRSWSAPVLWRFSKAVEGYRTPRREAFSGVPWRGFTALLSHLGVLLMLVLLPVLACAAIVYETPTELLTSGDFDGDGTQDVLVLDKVTGNARIGFQVANGTLTWSTPFPTGVDQASALAVGSFWTTNRDVIAVTSADLNRVHLLDFASSDVPVPTVLNPAHAGTTLLVGLHDPYGEGAGQSSLVVGASDPAMTLLDLFAFAGDGLASFQDQLAAEGYLASANPFRWNVGDTTLLAAMRRGNEDAFVVYSYTNSAGPVLLRPNLSPGTEYVYGRFNGEPHPRLLFYVPGQSNVIVQPLIQTGSQIHFGMPTLNTFSAPVRRIYYVEEDADGLVLIHFGDGLSGLRPQGGSGQLQATYRFGGGPTGNVITGVAPLGKGQFTLLSGTSNSVVSAHAQVFTQQGSDYVQTSSSPLPDVASGDRANLWLFQLEPFASSAAVLIGSMGAPAWTSQPSGLPGSLAVRVETDGGAELGLGNPGTTIFGAPPPGTVFALPNQYRADISFFGYARPRAPEPSVVTISPPPGSYGGPIEISFTRQNAAHEVHYRVAGVEAWQLYASPFPLAHDAAIQYYGSVPGGERGRMQFASYTLGNPASPIEPAVTLPGSETNRPPVIDPNIVRISTGGTVFYSRRGNHLGASIWAIDLDGSRDTYITAGAQPRVSPNGRWMAFQRENDPATNQTSLWLRDLTTGAEHRLRSSQDRFGGYDWYADSTGLIFDNECVFWHSAPAGPPMRLPLADNCRQHAPAIHPLDDRIAFQITHPGQAGLYIAPPDASLAQKIELRVPSPRWPVWSPDGLQIAFADDPSLSPVLAAGRDLWVLHLGAQTNLYQITGLTGAMDGFPHGGVWSPDGTALLGAGTVFGSNGLWFLPLTPNRDACLEMPIRLPTLPGDPIEFVGSIIEAPVLPELFIRRDGDWIVVFWHRTSIEFVLETATDPGAAAWQAISGPHGESGNFFEHAIPENELSSTSFYRLRHP